MVDLENQLAKMEQEIVRLNNIIDKYKFKIGLHVIGGEKDFGEFNELQECQRQTTIKSLKEGKSKEELQKNIREFAKVSGTASYDRK